MNELCLFFKAVIKSNINLTLTVEFIGKKNFLAVIQMEEAIAALGKATLLKKRSGNAWSTSSFTFKK